jgi:hypothetical protein
MGRNTVFGNGTECCYDSFPATGNHQLCGKVWRRVSTQTKYLVTENERGNLPFHLVVRPESSFT